MSIPLLIANLLTVLAFFAHTFVGDQEIHLLIGQEGEVSRQYRSTWTMARCGWHWVSLDLLIASVLMAMINFSEILPEEGAITLLLAIVFSAYGLIWVITVLVSPSFSRRFFLLGQWLLLLVIGGLLFLAI